MLSVLERMKSCIKAAKPAYRVNFGYSNILSDRPVTETAVYITAEEVRKTRVDFVIHVYTPLSLGGNECIKTACEVYNILYDGSLELKNIVIGAVEFNSNSPGFTVKIKGTAEDDSLKYSLDDLDPEELPISCYAILKTDSGSENYQFQADSCKVFCETGHYPIMTIFEGTPTDIVKDRPKSKIVLEGVNFEAMRVLALAVDFQLFVGTVRVGFQNCRCEKYERTTREEKHTLTIIGF